MSWWQWLLVSLAVVVGVYAAFVAWLVILGRRGEARALATFIPDCIVLVTRLAREPRVSRPRKLLLVALVGYLALPFDLVPDFIPVAGQLDDAIIVALVLRSFVRSSGEPLIRETVAGAGAVARADPPTRSARHLARSALVGCHSRTLAQANERRVLHLSHRKGTHRRWRPR